MIDHQPLDLDRELANPFQEESDQVAMIWLASPSSPKQTRKKKPQTDSVKAGKLNKLKKEPEWEILQKNYQSAIGADTAWCSGQDAGLVIRQVRFHSWGLLLVVDSLRSHSGQRKTSWQTERQKGNQHYSLHSVTQRALRVAPTCPTRSNGDTIVWGIVKKNPASNGWQNAASLKFDPKPLEAALSAVISNFEKCRPEAVDDVISGFAAD